MSVCVGHVVVVVVINHFSGGLVFVPPFCFCSFSFCAFLLSLFFCVFSSAAFSFSDCC